MPADAAAADGEHFTTDPLGCGGSSGLPDPVDLRNRFVVRTAGRGYVVRPSRVSTGVITPGRSVDRHRIELRQVTPAYF